MVLMNLSAGQQWRHRHREQTDGHGGREGGTDGESSMETYTLAYAKQIASGYLLYDLRNSNQGSVTTRGMGWGGRREGGSRGRGHMYTYDWAMLMYGKTQHNIVIILQLKINKLRKNYILKKWKRNAGSIPLRYGDQGWCDIPGTWVGLGPKAQYPGSEGVPWVPSPWWSSQSNLLA